MWRRPCASCVSFARLPCSRTRSTVPLPANPLPFVVADRGAMSVGLGVTFRHALEHIAHELDATLQKQNFADFADGELQRAGQWILDDPLAPYLPIGQDRHFGQLRGAESA